MEEAVKNLVDSFKGNPMALLETVVNQVSSLKVSRAGGLVSSSRTFLLTTDNSHQ
jgi:hypothetical protein